MTNEEMLSVAEIVERLSARFHKQLADHEAKMAEHRAAFGARTEADAKIIAGLREELDRVRNSLGIQAAKEANKVLGMVDGEGLRGAAERVVKERDGLLTQVQDMRAEMERLIKVGDLVEVVSNRGRNTWRADVGSLGTVTSVEEINDSISVRLDDVPGKQNALAGYVSLCDVRKVTT